MCLLQKTTSTSSRVFSTEQKCLGMFEALTSSNELGRVWFSMHPSILVPLQHQVEQFFEEFENFCFCRRIWEVLWRVVLSLWWVEAFVGTRFLQLPQPEGCLRFLIPTLEIVVYVQPLAKSYVGMLESTSFRFNWFLWWCVVLLYDSSCKKIKVLISWGQLLCHHATSVWMPFRMHSLNGKYFLSICGVSSSHLSQIGFMKGVFSLRHVFIESDDPWLLLNVTISYKFGKILPRWCLFSPNA